MIASYEENHQMTDGLASIITTLERQKAAIERALSALREVDGIPTLGTRASASIAKPEPSERKGKKRSAAIRKRMQEAQRARWAKIKGGSEPEPEPEPEPVPEAPKAKRKISPEGMKRIIAATKKRWALKRAEGKAATKKTKAKKAGRKKAVPAGDVVPL
jgi:hypothetical protein